MADGAFKPVASVWTTSGSPSKVVAVRRSRGTTIETTEVAPDATTESGRALLSSSSLTKTRTPATPDFGLMQPIYLLTGCRLSEPAWYVRAFEALVSPEALSRDRCLQACAIVGGLASASAVAAAFVAPPEFATVVLIQFFVGIAVLFGAALSWLWPPASRAYLILIGLALVAAVTWYPVFMADAWSARARSGVNRFSHAPGILAIGLAFGLRLLVDFGLGSETLRMRIARPIGLTGLAVGACVDALVVLLPIWLV